MIGYSVELKNSRKERAKIRLSDALRYQLQLAMEAALGLNDQELIPPALSPPSWGRTPGHVGLEILKF